MKRGPKPAPASVKIAAGITAPSDVNLHEPMPRLGPDEPPPPPDYLGPRAAAIWAAVLAEQHKGLILPIDLGILEAYCVVRDKREELGKLLMQSGYVIRGRRDEVVRNPVAIGHREAILLELRLGAELGIGPSSRAAIRMDPSGGEFLPDIGLPPRLRALPAAIGGEL